MSEEFRSSPISALPPIGSGVEGPRPAPSSPAETAAVDRPAAAPANSVAVRPEQRPDLKVDGKTETKAPAAPASNAPNVRLRFKVDPDTHDITVLMVDVGTHKVIRSIPADELKKLGQGELVELLA